MTDSRIPLDGGARRVSASALACLALLLLGGSPARPQTPDPIRVGPAAAAPLLLAGGTVIDGTGGARYEADVLVRDGRIVAIGEPGSLSPPRDAEVIELGGLALAPGFIDIHNHSTRSLWEDPLATTQVAQGVTTIVVGADGGSPWPIADYLARIDSLAPAVDLATLVGHGTIRRAILGDDFERPATRAEVEQMAERVERGMREGALGLSTGLEYDPGFYSDTEELIALARVAAAHGGFYMSHMRDEEEGLLDAVDEAIRIGREAGLPVHISHIKAGNASVWGKAGDVLARIGGARAAGLDVTADQYPYTAWQSGLSIVVRSRHFADPDSVAAGIAAAGGGERLQIVGYEPDSTLNGLRLSEIAASRGQTEVEAYMALMESGGSGVIGHTMNDADVETFLASPWVMTSSDGAIGGAHPRGAGAFARILGRYVRERGLLSLERAVQRATSMPARRLGLTDRGVIRPGARADLVAFDPATIADRATFTEPTLAAAGVRGVWVAGVRVWDGTGPTGERPGRAIRRP